MRREICTSKNHLHATSEARRDDLTTLPTVMEEATPLPPIVRTVIEVRHVQAVVVMLPHLRFVTPAGSAKALAPSNGPIVRCTILPPVHKQQRTLTQCANPIPLPSLDLKDRLLHVPTLPLVNVLVRTTHTTWMIVHVVQLVPADEAARVAAPAAVTVPLKIDVSDPPRLKMVVILLAFMIPVLMQLPLHVTCLSTTAAVISPSFWTPRSITMLLLSRMKRSPLKTPRPLKNVDAFVSSPNETGLTMIALSIIA